MDNEETKSGTAGGKKGVCFVEPDEEEPPMPPPRKNRKRRLSKSRRGVHFGNLPPEDDTSPGTESPEEHDSEDPDKTVKEPTPCRSSQESLSEDEEEEVPKSRLPELLRRDTFCDALDFRLYSLKRIPGRRSSSLDALYWQEEDEEYDTKEADPGMTRSAEHLPQTRADWLKTLLADDSKIDENPKSDEESKEELKDNEKKEENNNHRTDRPVLILDPAELTSTLEKIKSTHISRKDEHYHCVYSSHHQTSTSGTLKPPGDSPSRKSSMTESLQEFESSLIEMLKAQPTTDTEEEHHHQQPHQQPHQQHHKDILASANV